MNYKEEIKKLEDSKKKLWKEYTSISYKDDQAVVAEIPEFDRDKYVYSIQEDGTVTKIDSDNPKLIEKRNKRTEQKKVKSALDKLRKEKAKAQIKNNSTKEVEKLVKKQEKESKKRIKAQEQIEKAEKRAKEAAAKAEKLKKQVKA